MTNMYKRLTILAALLAAAAAFGCDDDNSSTLPAFDMPGAMHLVKQCVLNGEFIQTDACEAQNGVLSNMVFVSNSGDGTLAYVPFKNLDFDVVDITLSVPGVTSIPVGERPQSLTSDDRGIFVLVTSSIQNNLSIVSAKDLREIAYQELDKPIRRIAYQSSDNAFYAFFLDGTIRRLTLSFNCGDGENVYKTSCSLQKDMLSLKWDYVSSLDGMISDYIADPRADRGYVSYANRRYISRIAFTESAGACLDGASKYPCEAARLGAGYACADGIDNNNDGFIDNEDPSCFYPWSTEGYSTGNQNDATPGIAGKTECNDGLDNNGNGLFDALDPGCVSSDDASEDDGYQPMKLGTCADGIDNDGDGFIDREDPSCLWPTDDESSEDRSAQRTTGLCMDSVDNDGDTLADTDDHACYGRLGLHEGNVLANGRGQLGIDPPSRWLYVLNTEDSELIVIDLATEKTINLSGRFPRQRTIGVPVTRLAMDVVGDITSYTAYENGNDLVLVDDAVAYVSSSGGIVSEITIQKDFIHIEGNNIKETVTLPTFTSEDDDGDSAYVGVVRCVGRVCGDNDIPKISLRLRPAVNHVNATNTVSNIDPVTNLPFASTYDAILASETWRITYEGPLEKTEREDGFFSQDGLFRTTSADFCALGAREGDHLIITSNRNLNTSLPECQNLANETLEWTVSAVHPESLELMPTGKEGHASGIPLKKCFPNVLSYEVRASDAWIITSNSTYVNRRLPVGDRCVDNPAGDFGTTRFSLDKDRPKDVPDVTTAFFSLRMPDAAFNLVRDDAYEFTTKPEFTLKGVSAASAPSSLLVFSNDLVHYLLISEASSNAVIIYDVDDDSIYDTL